MDRPRCDDMAERRVLKVAAVAVLAALLVPAYALCPRPVPPVPAGAERDALIGSWSATVQSQLRLLAYSPFWRFGREDHRIELGADGRCHFRSHWQYSYIDHDASEDDAYYATSDCHWHVAETEVRRRGLLQAGPALQIRLRQAERSIEAVYVLGTRNDGLILWQKIGEPRVSAYMEFEKTR